MEAGNRAKSSKRPRIRDHLLTSHLSLRPSLAPSLSFHLAVQEVIKTVSFHRDITISVFEATIRVMGGLLSAHSLLIAPDMAPVFR